MSFSPFISLMLTALGIQCVRMIVGKSRGARFDAALAAAFSLCAIAAICINVIGSETDGLTHGAQSLGRATAPDAQGADPFIRRVWLDDLGYQLNSLRTSMWFDMVMLVAAGALIAITVQRAWRTFRGVEPLRG